MTRPGSQRGVAQNLQTFELREGEVARRQLHMAYDGFSRDRSGDKAVGEARYLNRLKSADAPVDVQLGNEDLLRGYAGSGPAAPNASSPAQTWAAGGVLNGIAPTRAGRVDSSTLDEARKTVSATLQNRFVGGRAFVMKTNSWIDSEIQKKANAKRVRVQFDSPEYFDLVKKNPRTTSWLAPGRNVQFVLGETIYEIYE